MVYLFHYYVTIRRLKMIPKLDEYKKRWQFESDKEIKLGLAAVEHALKTLGNPEKTLKTIHVSGTNGKGSTIQMMEAILQAHGYRTSSFTSPAIRDIHDQIRVNGENITSNDLDDAFKQLHQHQLSGTLTDFELLTVIAFVIFGKLQPDYVLIETGMGGLHDSTNVITPIVSVITSIALDHTQFLGTTIEEIARHKAGIIKNKVPVVIGELPIKAVTIVEKVAHEEEAPLRSYGDDFVMMGHLAEVFKGKKTFRLPNRKMKGPHQKMNTSVAIEALLMGGVALEEARIQQALQDTQLSHRFEEIMPNIFLDGAHNPAAARALRETIEETFPGEKVDFVVGMLRRKDLKGTLDELMPIANSFTFIHFDHPEAATAEELLANCSHSEKNVTQLDGQSLYLPEGNTTKIVVTGSLYLLANLKFNKATKSN